MGRCSAVLLATVQYAVGIILFKAPNIDHLQGLWISGVLALTSMFLVLWTLPLYPRKLRKLNTVVDFNVQYLVGCFSIEYFMADFWFPMETAVINLLPYLASVIDENAPNYNLDLTPLTNFMRNDSLNKQFMSFMTGFMTLMATLHATKVVDFCLLLCDGPRVFFQDISNRIKTAVRKLLPAKMRRSNRRSRSPSCQPLEEDDYDVDHDVTFDPDPDHEQPGDGIPTEYHLFQRR